jgi:hypothetical protein
LYITLPWTGCEKEREVTSHSARGWQVQDQGESIVRSAEESLSCRL